MKTEGLAIPLPDPAGRLSEVCEFDRILFDSGLVRVGAFLAHPSHPSFRESGPARNFCFVFPRTAVEIQHEHEPAFVANPNVVTFYNKGQAYQRSAISEEGDRCDWFGVDPEVARDVVRVFDATADSHPEVPFRRTHGWSDSLTYLLQRKLFNQLASGSFDDIDPFAIEEAVVYLLESVVASSYRGLPQLRKFGPKQRESVRHIEFLLSSRSESSRSESSRSEDRLTRANIADAVGLSPYYICRMFRRATGTTLNAYRQRLRLRGSLESVAGSGRPLVDLALEAGFSSHSHFTSAFRREFARTPSRVREGS
jgi:AraC-like DNA-binding protein